MSKRMSSNTKSMPGGISFERSCRSMAAMFYTTIDGWMWSWLLVSLWSLIRNYSLLPRKYNLYFIIWFVHNIFYVIATEPDDICVMGVLTGSGNVALPRWAFNPNSKQCTSFNYQGLLGNQNNFQSKGQCEKTCPG